MTAPTTQSSRVGRVSQLDESVAQRLQSACNFINAEVARVRRRVLTVVASIVTVGALVILAATRINLGSASEVFPPIVYMTYLLPAALTLWAVTSYWSTRQKELVNTFKHVVVRRVVAALGNNMTYSPQATLSTHDINATGLSVVDLTWELDDEVHGRKNNVTYSIVDATALLCSPHVRQHASQRVDFRGLIVRLDFNKNFVGQTTVQPRGDWTPLGMEATTSDDKELVRLENVEFEKRYSVYGRDQQEARYLLTPKLMELFLEASDALGGKLRAAFAQNHLYLAIPRAREQFHLGILSRDLTPQTIASDLIQAISIAERLVDTLELETRIWSRV